MLFPTRTAARIIFSFFFSLLHLSFHPQAKVVHPIDRIGRSSRGSSSILADILSLQFSNSQEFDAQTVLERSEFRERHPSNSLQPGRSIARRTTKADCTIGVVLVTRSIQFRVGHRKKNSHGNRPREASRQGDGSRRFGHEFRNIIIGRVSAHFLPRMDGKYENFYEFIITADIIVTRNAI